MLSAAGNWEVTTQTTVVNRKLEGSTLLSFDNWCYDAQMCCCHIFVRNMQRSGAYEAINVPDAATNLLSEDLYNFCISKG